ncbi:GAF domain-containing protein [Streptomyces anulatus]
MTLVDEERSFWKSCVGVEAPALAQRQNPVREGFCYFLVGLAGDPFIVDDAAADRRTREHPSVGPMDIGAWAGYPLMSPDGQVLGSFCVIDAAPRTWSQNDLITLATLARSVRRNCICARAWPPRRKPSKSPPTWPTLFSSGCCLRRPH